MTHKMLASALAFAVATAAFPAGAKIVELPKSVAVTLPDGLKPFSGQGADAINNNCLACHSRGMVLTQPALPKAVWEAEVAKMRNVFKAPVSDGDVPAIIDYLVRIKGPK